MKKGWFRSQMAVFLAAVFLCSALPQTALAAPAETAEIVVYHTNDTHGYLSGDGSSTVGLDKVAALKASTPNSILVDAGDATQGLPIASLTKGADVITLMNLAGYDLMTAGNHEFDFGTEQFLSNVALANFPVLAANVYREGKPLLSGQQEGGNGCRVIIERSGVKVGFFGLTTVDTATATNPTGIAGLVFQDEIETAKREIDALEAEGADVLIAVCHIGNGDVECSSMELARALTGEYQDKLDVIIDGHSHTVEDTEENGVLIVQTGSGLANVGKLTLKVGGGEVSASDELLAPTDLAGLSGDPAVAKKLEEITASQAELLEEVIGETNTTLWAGWIGDVAMTRLVETNFGDLAADAYLESGLALLKKREPNAEIPVIAVENGGGIREALQNGPITMGSLISAFPFSNTLYMKKITPEILYQMMEISASCLDGQDGDTGMLLQQTISGGFLQVAGFSAVLNPDAVQGERVASITLDGAAAPLDRSDRTTQLLLVSNNYIMDGGNGYTMLAGLPKYGETGGELETVQAYLEKCLAENTLADYAVPQGRIAMRGDIYEPKDYTASIRIVDGAGRTLPNQMLSYRVDGGDGTDGVTDENGILHVALSDGAHSIRISEGQRDVYVDNYAGIGIVEDAVRSFPVLTFTQEEGSGPDVVAFDDIESGAWYYDAVDFVCHAGWMTGTGIGTFAPDGNASRATVVTTLWRMEGSPAAGSGMSFGDVTTGTWYEKAVCWSAAEGVMEGYGESRFAPDDPVTREQLAVILWRYAGYKGCDISVGRDTNLLSYSDAFEVGEWAIPAMQWACASGVMEEMDAGTLSPEGCVTRAQLAAMLQRFCERLPE